MRFELLPIIDTMLNLYAQPRTPARFQTYLKLLQGETKGDLVLPIGNFNPMAKAHLTEKLLELKNLRAEELLESTIAEINENLPKTKNGLVYKLALNVADDAQGGWTNKFTTDYDSKFKFNALFARQFCVPILFSSETISENLVISRTKEYCFRTVYWSQNSKPKTLKDYVEQEIFVTKNLKTKENLSQNVYQNLDTFYKKHQDSEHYEIIFNFFYGDAACESLNFPKFGVEEQFSGFKYSAHQPL